MLTIEQINVLMKLVVEEQAREMIDGILIESGPLPELVELKRLEVELIKMKAGG